MISSRSESLRAQLELPLSKRQFFFALLSALILRPLSVVWASVAYVRFMRRQKRVFSPSDDVRLVSVGNVSVGGTGKSPIVRALVRLALDDSYDVAVMTRGYSASGASSRVISKIHAGFFDAFDHTASLLTDETLEHALFLHSSLTESTSCWICQGKDRQALFESLVAQWRESESQSSSGRGRKLAVILDDGLQQTSLSVHRDVVVWDPRLVRRAPQVCLPYGPYRMGFPIQRFWSWAVPAGDLIVWSRVQSSSEQTAFLDHVRGASQKLGIKPLEGKPSQIYCSEKLRLAQVSLSAGQQIVQLSDNVGSSLPARIHLMCGIARPERFETSVNIFLREQGLRVEVESCLAFSDHGPLSRDGLNLLATGQTVVTTLKDLSRWWRSAEVTAAIRRGHLYVLCLDVELMNSESEKMSMSFDELFQFQ